MNGSGCMQINTPHIQIHYVILIKPYTYKYCADIWIY